MNERAIIELEELIYQIKKRPLQAANTVADIIGVVIGLKPTTITTFELNEFSDSSYNQFVELLKRLGLEALFFKKSLIESNEVKWVEYVFISLDQALAVKAYDAFEELWNTMDDYGQIYASEKWQDATIKLGKLVGYPDTAVMAFADSNNRDINSRERVERTRRNRYYAHSTEHEQLEYETYDLKLNQAIAKLAPRTAELYANDKTKRWL
ncbi:hypothetical protein IKG10_01980 [Candidatus Saccharibacteria bacterium]|nr:hypothetical protein [Candidatus Saccharibacteria bacterium]